MNLRGADLQWLASSFPEMEYVPDHGTIEGLLRFCAAFDRSSGQLMLGDATELQSMDAFLCDAFEVRVELRDVGGNGWPKVYEVGGRCSAIAEHNQCQMIDLHLFDDGACCLGLNYARARNLTLQRFMQELVIPFLYRLAYTDRYGLNVARSDLWGEYPHGNDGKLEYQEEILHLAANNPGRNQLCPCGSGVKFKRCHLEEVEAVKRKLIR